MVVQDISSPVQKQEVKVSKKAEEKPIQAASNSSSIPQEVTELAKKICAESKIVFDMRDRLKNLTYTTAQLDRLATIAVEGMVNTQTQAESSSEKATVQKIHEIL